VVEFLSIIGHFCKHNSRKLSSANKHNQRFLVHIPMEYSRDKDAGYCYSCLFRVSESGKSDVAFTQNGFHDWKHALGNKYDISYLKTSWASTLRSDQELSWQPFSVG